MEFARQVRHIYRRLACAIVPRENSPYIRYLFVHRGFFGNYFDIPGKVAIAEITLAELNALNTDWQKVLNYPLTQTMGDTWLQKMEAAVLKVPSAIIDLEYNYLFNPAHPDFEKIKIAEISKFSFDQRLRS